MTYLTHAITWGLSEALFARTLYSIHHALLYRTMTSADYTQLSITMGIIYGLFTILDLGLFDTIAPWFSYYTASKQHFRRALLPQLILCTIPLTLAYSLMLFYHPLPYPSLIIIIGLMEQTKRHLRMLLNLFGAARFVALIEGFSYFSYVTIAWSLYYVTHTMLITPLLCTLALTSISSVLLLALRTYYLYHSLPAYACSDVAKAMSDTAGADTRPASIPWSAIIRQRAACTIGNLATVHGLHTLVVPLLAAQYTTNGALLSCINAIVGAMSTIIYKIITVAGAIVFNPPSPSLTSITSRYKAATAGQAPQNNYHSILPRMVRIVTIVWTITLVATTIICSFIAPTLTSYLFMSISLYAIPSFHHITKLALDSRSQSAYYSTIITISSLCTHLLFYGTITTYISPTIAITLIMICALTTFAITYHKAHHSLSIIPAKTTIIDRSADTQHDQLVTP